eukprot:CAMPEP_0177522494 /NCGR_PEP_ID=MMETSP0369-20130122/48828_1 /TAXON_ID=447022 ORGANISM="Scrippsiella hangoei-like, Strain SHHI-4" /NCGR_SAMPLE_ID=MMETSP0369 /ASSEMBLY_ACC=CAM_ASM_000364 /LENGTH=48 /DNA_ID= /DNA_START= /DNA_END= /DNA_ORIENTATION=
MSPDGFTMAIPDGFTMTMVWMEPMPYAGKVERGITVADATGVMSLPMY